MKVSSLSDFTGPSRESGAQLCFQHCPVCGSQKWKTYVNPETGRWYCHAPDHSGGGQVDVGLPMSGAGREILEQLAGKPQDRPAWPEVALPAWTPLCARAQRYLTSRGIGPSQATELGIVEVADSLRILVPYYGPSRRIIYWSARAYSALEDGPKYMAAAGRHPLYVLPSWKAHDEVVVVEGVFDAIAVHAHTGVPAVALGGKSLARYLEPDLLDLCRGRMRVMLDGDALDAAMKIRARLGTKRMVEVVPLEMGTDPADMGEKLKELIA